jgi:hypothetical protein
MNVKQNIKITLSRYVSSTMLGLKTTIKSTIVLASTHVTNCGKKAKCIDFQTASSTIFVSFFF